MDVIRIYSIGINLDVRSVRVKDVNLGLKMENAGPVMEKVRLYSKLVQR